MQGLVKSTEIPVCNDSLHPKPVPAFMVKPLKMAVPLLSVHPLLDQCLLHLYPTHMTDLPTYLFQAPARNCFYQSGHEGPVPLLISLVNNEHSCMLSRFSLVQLLVTIWTIAHQSSLSMGFSRQKYRSRVDPLLGIISTQDLSLHLLQLLPYRRILYSWATRKASTWCQFPL